MRKHIKAEENKMSSVFIYIALAMVPNDEGVRNKIHRLCRCG